MAFSLFFAKNRPINFVFNDHSIRYLELKQTNPPAAQKWSERFLPPGIIKDGKIIDFDSLTNIFEECVDEWGIRRRPIRFLIPDSLVIIRKVSVPLDISDDEIEGYLYMELGATIHLPFDDPVFDVYPLGITEKSKEFVLFSAPEKHVAEYARLFSGLKLNPVAADISPLALYRLYYQLGLAAENEIILMVQFTLTNVTLCIFENAVPAVMRSFSINFVLEEWDIKQNGTDIDVKYIGEKNELRFQFEEVFKEINKFLDFYRYSLSKGKKELSKFLLNGDHPMLHKIYEEMQDRFNSPVHLLSLEGNNDTIPARFYLSLGLALKEVR